MPPPRKVPGHLESDPKKMLERLVGLPEVTVLGLSSSDERFELHIESITERPGCPATWTTAGDVFDFLSRAVGDLERPALAAKARALLGPAFEHLGWDARPGEDERTPLVRLTLVRTLGTVGADEAIQREAARRFDTDVVEGDLADAVVRVVASLDRHGDCDEMLRRFHKAKDPLTEERYRTGVAAFGSEARCLQTLANCFETFRSQDAPIVIVRLMFNLAGGTTVWSAVTERWDEMLERITPLMQWLLGLGLSFQVSDPALLRRAVEFHRSHPVQKRQKSVEQALEELGNRVRSSSNSRNLVGCKFAKRGAIASSSTLNASDV